MWNPSVGLYSTFAVVGHIEKTSTLYGAHTTQLTKNINPECMRTSQHYLPAEGKVWQVEDGIAVMNNADGP